MHVQLIVRQFLQAGLRGVHAARLTAVVVVADAIVRAGDLTMAGIGRAIIGRAEPKNQIKRVDRLLSNGKLHSQRITFFRALAQAVLGPVTPHDRPVVLVDWTALTKEFNALYAMIPVGGRAVTVYCETHPLEKLGNERVQSRFLDALRSVLPPGCRPIVVSDAGFHGPFFRHLLAVGWDFVGRIRGTAKARRMADGRVASKETLYRSATQTAQDLGSFDLYTTAEQVRARLVLIRQRGKRERVLPPAGTKDEREFRKSARDPWLLATSLQTGDAASIVRIYAKRMQIEETFRDLKNVRSGWCLRHVRSRSAVRLDTLLLLAAVAMLAITIVGLRGERLGRHRHYQANTATVRVLSYVVLGTAMLRRQDPAACPLPADVASVLDALLRAALAAL